MAKHSYDCGTLTIANGAANSGNLAADPHYQAADNLVITSENSAHTNTITIAVSNDGGTNFRTLQSGGTNVGIGADEAIILTLLGFTHLRLESSGNEGAERTFRIRAMDSWNLRI